MSRRITIRSFRKREGVGRLPVFSSSGCKIFPKCSQFGFFEPNLDLNKRVEKLFFFVKIFQKFPITKCVSFQILLLKWVWIYFQRSSENELVSKFFEASMVKITLHATEYNLYNHHPFLIAFFEHRIRKNKTFQTLSVTRLLVSGQNSNCQGETPYQGKIEAKLRKGKMNVPTDF